MLRNPELENNGTLYPDNIYEIRKRIVTEEENSSQVIVFLKSWTDAGKQHPLREREFKLKDLPKSAKQLIPELYYRELLRQHGEKVVDRTPLSDFIKI